jgi:hypothetical protein
MMLNFFFKKIFLLFDDLKNNRIKTIYYTAKNKDLNKIYKEELKKIRQFLDNDKKIIEEYANDFINNFCIFIDGDYSSYIHDTFNSEEFKKSLERDVKLFDKFISNLENSNYDSYESFISNFYDYENEFKTLFKIPEKILDYYCLTSFLFKILSDVDLLTIFNKLGISKELKEIFGNKYVNASNLSFYIFLPQKTFYVSYDPLDFLHASYNKPWTSCYNISNGSYILSLFFYSISFNSMIIFEINDNNNNIFMFYNNILKNDRFISRKLLANPVINDYELLMFNSSKKYGDTDRIHYLNLFHKFYNNYKKFDKTDDIIIKILIGEIVRIVSEQQSYGQYYDALDVVFYNNWHNDYDIANSENLLNYIGKSFSSRRDDVIYKHLRVKDRKNFVDFCDLWGFGKNKSINSAILNRNLLKKGEELDILQELGIDIEIPDTSFKIIEKLDIVDIL